MADPGRPIAIWYEHPGWFRPLFRELEGRGLPFVRLHAAEHAYDPAGGPPDWALLVNRMSPSAHLRGHGAAVAHTLAYLERAEAGGVPVVNGLEAFRTEISKARQLRLMASLGLPHPATRVVADAEAVPAAAEEVGFPVLVKANRGGSGAGIRRYDDAARLEAAAADGDLDLGPDGTALVQEFVPARDGVITRVEVLGGSFLYAIRVHLAGEGFDLCPADLCPASASAAERAAGPTVEAADPPEEVVRAVEALAGAAGIDVGGVEYLVDDRDGTVRFYDVNALSNFVAEPERVVGFDPHARLVDWLGERARGAGRGPEPATGGVEPDDADDAARAAPTATAASAAPGGA